MTISERVSNYPTKHKWGFIQSEIDDLLKEYPNINMDKFNEALMGNTCMIIDKEVINYHCDIELALHCGMENRSPKAHEID
jgi:hypothetical protein